MADDAPPSMLAHHRLRELHDAAEQIDLLDDKPAVASAHVEHAIGSRLDVGEVCSM